MKKELGYGVALVGAVAAAGALAAALVRKKKREEIYHEAELKAMNELDEMMTEGDDELDCDACSCAAACAAADEQQEDVPEDIPSDETEKPAE